MLDMWIDVGKWEVNLPIPTHAPTRLTPFSDPNPLRSRGREGRG